MKAINEKARVTTASVAAAMREEESVLREGHSAVLKDVHGPGWVEYK